MKKIILLATALCLLLMVLVGCNEEPTPSYIGGFTMPMVFVNDTLYSISPFNGNPELDENWVFVGEVESYVPTGSRPNNHLQTNFNNLTSIDVVGVARVYHSPNALFHILMHSEEVFTDQHIFQELHGDGIIIDINGHHFHFVSSLLSERINDIMAQRIPQLLLIDDVLYNLVATASGGDFQANNNHVFIGEIASHVLPNEFPRENFQANDEIVGARVYLPISGDGIRYDVLVLFDVWRMEYRRFNDGNIPSAITGPIVNADEATTRTFTTHDKEGALVEVFLLDGNKFAIHREFVSHVPNGEYTIDGYKFIFTIGSEIEYIFSYENGKLIFESGTWLENWIEIGTVLTLS